MGCCQSSLLYTAKSKLSQNCVRAMGLFVHFLPLRLHRMDYLSPFEHRQCEWPACFECATAHFTRIEGRIPIEQKNVCRLHASRVFETYWSDAARGGGSPCLLTGAAEFDVAFTLLDDQAEWGAFPYHVYLRQIGGTRLIGFRTGFYEWWAVGMALMPTSTPYPTTHKSIRNIIESLHGKVDRIVIDDFVVTEQRLSPSLHIRQTQGTVSVAVRPTDACVLAIVCEVPIFVRHEVLANRAEELEQKWQR